jgi:hypothetical protein
MFLFQGKGIGSKMFDFAESLAPVSEVGVISGLITIYFKTFLHENCFFLKYFPKYFSYDLGTVLNNFIYKQKLN